MATTTFNLNALPPELAEAIAAATPASELIIVANHVPVAKVIVCTPNPVRVPGLHAGTIHTSDDFDAPLSEEFWTGGQ